jgi:hypothetical protein
MRLAYAMVKFSVNNGKSLTSDRAYCGASSLDDLAAIADPNVRVKTVHSADTIIGAGRPENGGSSSRNLAS